MCGYMSACVRAHASVCVQLRPLFRFLSPHPPRFIRGFLIFSSWHNRWVYVHVYSIQNSIPTTESICLISDFWFLTAIFTTSIFRNPINIIISILLLSFIQKTCFICIGGITILQVFLYTQRKLSKNIVLELRTFVLKNRVNTFCYQYKNEIYLTTFW